MSIHKPNGSSAEEVFELPNLPSSRFESPSQPLNVELGDISDALPMPDGERQLLIDYATWKQNPPFDDVGRSAAVYRKQRIEIDGVNVEGYKLKGVGHCQSAIAHTRIAGKIKPPTSQIYESGITEDLARGLDSIRSRFVKAFSGAVHMGIQGEGKLVPIPEKPRPLGGMGPGRGENEFNNAVALHQANVPACGPVVWGKYSDLEWEGKPMEFVGLSLPTRDSLRIGHYFEPEVTKSGVTVSRLMRGLIDKVFDTYNPNRLGTPMLKVVAQMSYAIGETLRKVHEDAELVRFAGHTGNFNYDPDGRIAYIHDYDSAVALESIDPTARGLSIVRDIESALVGLAHSVAYSNLFYLLGDDVKFQRNNPLMQLMKGYFAQDRDQMPEAMREFSRVINKKTVDLIKSRGEFPGMREQSMWLDRLHVQFGQMLMIEVSKVYAASSMNEKNTLPYSADQLGKNLSQFQKDQKEVRRHRVTEEFKDESYQIRQMAQMMFMQQFINR